MEYTNIINLFLFIAVLVSSYKYLVSCKVDNIALHDYIFRIVCVFFIWLILNHDTLSSLDY